ncbi:MAG: polysaccharide deacetylase family protein [Methylococcales bacterium]|nr:polysaccharide deacetylase family protein [Methylococcales bacterium]
MALQLLCTLASGLGKRKKLFILIFHRVLDGPDSLRPWEIDSETFAWQMALIAKYFNVMAFSEAIERMENHTLPSRAMCITFDDGYADNYTNALPILLQNKLSAIFFIASGYLDGGRMWNDSVIESLRVMPGSRLDLSKIGLDSYDISSEQKKADSAIAIIQNIKHLDPDVRTQHTDYIVSLAKKELPHDLMLSSQQLAKLHVSGMEIGGHTVSHPILATLSLDAVKQEVCDNKASLERLLSAQVRFFAYPNGKPGQDYLPEQVHVIKNCGYEAAVSTLPGVSTALDDPWQLARFTPWDKHPLKFMLRIAIEYFQLKRLY